MDLPISEKYVAIMSSCESAGCHDDGAFFQRARARSKEENGEIWMRSADSILHKYYWKRTVSFVPLKKGLHFLIREEENSVPLKIRTEDILSQRGYRSLACDLSVYKDVLKVLGLFYRIFSCEDA